MTPVRNVLRTNSTLKQAVTFMNTYKWNTVPILDESERLIGVFTRSCLYKMILEEKSLSSPITPYIKRDVVVLPLHLSYDQLRIVIKKAKVGTGVVIDENGNVVGLMTKTDFVNALLHMTESLKQQLMTVIDNTPFGILMTDENGIVTFVDQTCCEMLNHPEKNLIGASIQDVFPLFSHSESFHVQCSDTPVMVRSLFYEIDREKKGEIFLLQYEMEVEKLANELQSVKNLKSILDTAVNHAYDGIIMVDEKGNITFFNKPILELFNLPDQQLKNQHIEHVLPNLKLTEILSTGVADVSGVQEIKGIKYIVHRIPIYQEEKIIGAIAKISFRQLHEVLHQVKKNHQPQKRKKTSTFSIDNIVMKSERMKKVLKGARIAAKGKSTILIRGESGTGKELFAKALHYFSLRNDKPFITVNCAAIPEQLLESEFFGYEKGAFTGAKQTGQMGKFELADGGTLFLDEIGDMSLSLQAKLLRVFQEKEFYRVGGTEPISVDVRIIAATHQSLEEMVEKGLFRKDLYYRLNVISFELPSLRERKEDIPLLTEHFIQELNEQNGTSVTKVSEQAMDVLLHYSWPGNIRELRNIIEHGIIFAEHGIIEEGDLPDYLKQKVSQSLEFYQKGDASLIEVAEKKAIIQALTESSGNKVKAAKLLGISRSILYKKLKKYNLTI